jgi:hypothetical protein
MQRRNGRQQTMKIKHSRCPIPAVMQSRRGARITSTVPARPDNCNGIREKTMTDRPDVSPWRKLLGITLLSSLFVPPAPVLAQDIVSATAVAADPLNLAAEDTASCLQLRDPDVRLACFDAAAHRLAEALGSMDQAGRNAGDLPIGPDAPDAPAGVEPLGDAPVAVEPSGDAPAAVEPLGEAAEHPPIGPDVPDAAAAVEPSGEAAEDPPNWAAAPQPQPRDVDQADAPRRFEATIVRITSNNVGRHRFYTADGAVWEQTQIVEVRQPSSLPAVAEFRRRLTGNPTIKFDVSNRSYRVIRIE